MREYWVTQDLLNVAAMGYLVFVILAVALALWLPKNGWGKLLAVAAVLLLSVAIPNNQVNKERQQLQAAADDRKERYAKAKALFDERCKTAGERIFRTVENVEGVLLLNVRQRDPSGDSSDPMWPDAGLPKEVTGEGYIRHFLYAEYDGSPPKHTKKKGERGYLSVGVSGRAPELSKGFRFVDVRQPGAATLRYRLKNSESDQLVVAPLKGESARYAVGYENLVTEEDRAYWVAGTIISVMDTHTGETLARRESYAFEAGLGSKAGFRQPWRFAVTCPSHFGWDGATTRFFVDQVLKPRPG